ncbi:MAG: ABC transporter substrate-binding protein, partial [bacterium]
KRILTLALAGLLLLSCVACGGGTKSTDTDLIPYTPDETATDTDLNPHAEEPTDEPTVQAEETPAEAVTIRVGSLKGPTTMGLVNLMKSAENGETENTYAFTMATAPDEIAAGVVGGNFDIALLPANLAAVLYKKTDAGVSVIDINTLGVLYCVTGDESIQSVSDLAGKTVYMTGQGATPEYALRFLLDKYGVTDCTLEFRSEATEIAALLKEDASLIAILPQPFATVAQVQNEALREAFNLTDAWAAVEKSSMLLTGVTIVRKEFLEAHPEEVLRFLGDHAESAIAALTEVESTAALVAEYGIIEKAPIAQRALPKCGVTCLTGETMQEALSGYLAVLYASDPSSVGGALPDDAFYYVG